MTKHLKECAAFAEEAQLRSNWEELEPSSPVYGLASSINRREVAIARYKIYYITDGTIGNRTKGFTIPPIKNAVVDWHVIGIERLFAAAETGGEREPIEIDFATRGGAVPCLRVQEAEDLTTYLLALSGNLVADLYHEHGTRLLEANVRAFLSGRGKVNRGIRTTLQNAPEKFMSYNNGITATASDVKCKSVGDQLVITNITDLQIVNGGQTTASLFYSRRDYKADLSDAWVQVKLVQVDPCFGEKLVPEIARYANSQNKVSEADFFSNHPYHQRLEQLGNQQVLAPAAAGSIVSTHWFYERTRGSWDNQRTKFKTASLVKQFEAQNPRNQIITKTDAAKYLVTWEGRPHIVSQGAQKNFMAFADNASSQWDASENSINREYYQQLVSLAILFAEIRLSVLKSDWYDKGYLANIATYTMAAFRKKYVTQFNQELDLEIIWREQRVPEPQLDSILPLAKATAEVLTSADRPLANVTEWAKRAQCWDQVQAIPITFPSDLKEYGISRDKATRRRASAAEKQRTDTQLLTELELMKKPPEFWESMMDFGRKNRLIDSRKERIITMLSKGQYPSEQQFRMLSELVRKAEILGFTEP